MVLSIILKLSVFLLCIAVLLALISVCEFIIVFINDKTGRVYKNKESKIKYFKVYRMGHRLLHISFVIIIFSTLMATICLIMMD